MVLRTSAQLDWLRELVVESHELECIEFNFTTLKLRQFPRTEDQYSSQTMAIFNKQKAYAPQEEKFVSNLRIQNIGTRF